MALRVLLPHLRRGDAAPRYKALFTHFSWGSVTMMDDTVTTAQLAEIIGVSARTIRDMAAKGTIPRTGAGKFPFPGSVQAAFAHLREQAAGRGNGDGAAMAELSAERLREARERADKIAIQNAKARREMVPAAEVERAWTEVLRDVRARMLAVPARVRARLGHLTHADSAVIEEEVRDALQGAADAR